MRIWQNQMMNDLWYGGGDLKSIMNSKKYFFLWRQTHIVSVQSSVTLWHVCRWYKTELLQRIAFVKRTSNTTWRKYGFIDHEMKGFMSMIDSKSKKLNLQTLDTFIKSSDWRQSHKPDVTSRYAMHIVRSPWEAIELITSDSRNCLSSGASWSRDPELPIMWLHLDIE